MAARSSFEIITPSYAPDYELCADLVASVRKFAPSGTVHRLIVPTSDMKLFSALASHDVVVESVDSILPRQFRKLPFSNIWINWRAPWPPVRGWIAQQLVKLAAAAASTADVVVLVDSDVTFGRPFDLATYGALDGPALFRLADAVGPHLPRHVMWDEVARRLLDVPVADPGPLPDYICWPCIWIPELVRGALSRVESVSGLPWSRAISRELHFSEMVLYGVYVDEIVRTDQHVEIISDMRSVAHSDEVALDARSIEQFLSKLGDDRVAVMVSAKSGTALGIRRAALGRYL